MVDKDSAATSLSNNLKMTVSWVSLEWRGRGEGGGESGERRGERGEGREERGGWRGRRGKKREGELLTCN